MFAPLLKRAAAALALTIAPFGMTSGAHAAPAPATREEFPTPAGFTPGYARADGVTLHYLKGGRGPLVLLVHGFGQSWYEWHQLMPILARTHMVVAEECPATLNPLVETFLTAQ